MGIKDIPVSEEVLKESAAHVLAHPPKFPLLRGDEEKQVCERIVSLMKSGDIIWIRQHLATGGVSYTAEYKNLVLEINPHGHSLWFELKLSIKGASVIHDWVLENTNSGTPLCELLEFVEQQFDERTKIRMPVEMVEVVDDRVTIWNVLDS